MNLPSDLLRTFVTVAELGGVTSAGEVLGRSQPAVSLQIKRLEELVNMPLFLRQNRRLELTESGRRLFDYARQILALNDEAVASLIQPKVSGRVHLGIPDEFAASFLPDILRRFAQSHPEVEVQVTCDLSVNLLNRMQSQEFDMVLALHKQVAPETAACAWTEELVWMGATACTAQHKTPLPLIVATEGCVYRSRIIRTLDSQAKPWRIAYTSPNFSGILAGVLAGIGITAVARSTVAEGMRILGSAERLPRLASVEMGLHYERGHISAAAYRLAEFISIHVGASSPKEGVIDTTDQGNIR